MPQLNVYSHTVCPTIEITSYIDGELTAERELALETHIVGCYECAEELRLQRQFLCSLNSSMVGEFDLELPANFTERLVTNAESSVNGLRRSNELYSAAFVCVALMAFVLFALGSDANLIFGQLVNAAEKITAVGNFVGHIAYSLLIGFGVILRTVSGQIQLPAALMLVLGMVVALSVFISRSKSRVPRT
ncbi:MAG: zf-HC2 domain-containing protein [Chloracidobacterium sp.]|nr:zf-HC2 domain-containing protein [Chloracidobacterium sp.]